MLNTTLQTDIDRLMSDYEGVVEENKRLKNVGEDNMRIRLEIPQKPY